MAILNLAAAVAYSGAVAVAFAVAVAVAIAVGGVVAVCRLLRVCSVHRMPRLLGRMRSLRRGRLRLPSRDLGGSAVAAVFLTVRRLPRSPSSRRR